MIEPNKICEILQGGNIYSTFYINGWCKTSSGESFEKERIKELLDYIELEKNDIGLKDINGKSIYADSSIVEYGIQKWKVIYNVFQMSYELECVSNKSLSNMRLTGAYQNQLKIIDTIQENKLGLIK